MEKLHSVMTASYIFIIVEDSMPSHPAEVYEKLCFSLICRNKKYLAKCEKCGYCLTNTSGKRLLAHRKVCGIKPEKKRRTSKEPYSAVSDNDVPASECQPIIIIDEHGNEEMLTEKHVSVTDNGDEITQLNDAPTSTPMCNLRNFSFGSACEVSYINENNSPAVDRFPNKNKRTLSRADCTDMDITLGHLFFACKIPFSVVDSFHFRNFVKTLCPSYSTRIPTQETLSTVVLNTAYERITKLSKKSVVSDSILLVDSWKSKISETYTIVTSLRNENGNKVFLNANDTKNNQIEKEKILDEIINESVDIAKRLYNTAIFAVVTDFTSSDEIMCTNIWRINSSCCVANKLAQDVVEDKINEDIRHILKSFNYLDSDNRIIDTAGSCITLVENDWRSHRSCFKFFLESIGNLRQVATASSHEKSDLIKKLYDNSFISHVKDMVTVLDSICDIVSISQDNDSCLADVVHRWLHLTLPERISYYIGDLENYKSMAVNVYGMAAYYLHPKYHDQAQCTLSQEQRRILNQFFVEQLDNDGLGGLCDFENKKGIFRILQKKENLPVSVFWGRVRLEHKTLANLALKISKIPASTAQLEDLCPVSTFMQEGISVERQKKLMYMYYSLQLADSSEAGDSDF